MSLEDNTELNTNNSCENTKPQEPPTTIKGILKNIINRTTYDHLDGVINFAIVVLVGAAVILAIIYQEKEIASSLGGGLLGYLGKTAQNKLNS
jgi:hypothetical protein